MFRYEMQKTLFWHWYIFIFVLGFFQISLLEGRPDGWTHQPSVDQERTWNIDDIVLVIWFPTSKEAEMWLRHEKHFRNAAFPEFYGSDVVSLPINWNPPNGICSSHTVKYCKNKFEMKTVLRKHGVLFFELSFQIVITQHSLWRNSKESLTQISSGRSSPSTWVTYYTVTRPSASSSRQSESSTFVETGSNLKAWSRAPDSLAAKRPFGFFMTVSMGDG